MKRFIFLAIVLLSMAAIANAQDRLLVVEKPSGECFTFTNPGRVSFVERGDPNEGWTSLGCCLYGEDYVASVMHIGRYGDMCCDYYVEVQEKDNEPGMYRLVDPYSPDVYPYGEYCVQDGEEDHYYLVIDATDPGHVFIEKQYMGVEVSDFGKLYAWCLAGYFLGYDHTEEELMAEGYYGTLEDGVITFPTGCLMSAWDEFLYKDANNYGNFKVDLNDTRDAPGAKAPVGGSFSGVRPIVDVAVPMDSLTGKRAIGRHAVPMAP